MKPITLGAIEHVEGLPKGRGQRGQLNHSHQSYPLITSSLKMGSAHSWSQWTVWDSLFHWSRVGGFTAIQGSNSDVSPGSGGYDVCEIGKMQADFAVMNHETDFIFEKLRKCENTLVALVEKEKILCEGVEELKMELHDHAAGNPEFSEEEVKRVEVIRSGIDTVMEILQELREKRERLQERSDKLMIHLRLVEAERGESLRALDTLEEEKRYRAGHFPVDEEEENNMLRPPSPVAVEIVHDYCGCNAKA